jgi:cytochrome c oxidase subunit 3
LADTATTANGHPGPSPKAFGLKHQFDDLAQQHATTSLGMWIFLVQEVMFFGGLMCGYVVYRTMYPGAWHAGSHELSIILGAFNTGVLIASSFTMAMAVYSAQTGKNRALIGFLIATLILGSVFLGVKVYEYNHKWEEGLVPGLKFHPQHLPANVSAPHVQLFFAFYFSMTGMHALHMVIGAGLLIWLIVLAQQRRFSPEHCSHVDYVGLYWHFVDIVWIFLFPLLYLLGRNLR